MNTLVLAAEDGGTYRFAIGEAEITDCGNGLLVGETATVVYRGRLDPGRTEQTVQPVEVVRVVLTASGGTAAASGTTGTASAVGPTAAPPAGTQATTAPGLPGSSGARVEAILAGMTWEEKVGQMFIARCPSADAVRKAADNHLGGYILFGRDFSGKTKAQVIQAIQSYQDASEIPLLIGVDEEGGTVNRVSLYPEFRTEPFPSPQELYRLGGFDAVRSDAVEKCRLLKGLGINLNLAPVCDVSVNPEDFMYGRTFGKDAGQTARYVETVVRAMKEQGMGCVLKHFPGYGNNEDTHTGVAYDHRPYETFAASDFLPFQAGIDAGADIVLVSHNIVRCMDSLYPASLSPRVHEILREELGFDGVIVTDELAMDGIRDFVDAEQAAVLAVQAGNDLLCCTDFEAQIPAVLRAVEDGVISKKQIDRSVRRILELKLSLGLLS
ncbi:MAG TPA: beta-hexosaminidase [Firmicutes bacterium]|nr:beta-hexosaminidase [Bacillota bacterium]